MSTTAMAIVIGFFYLLGVILTERMNKQLHDFDENFPIIGLAWIFWPFTIFTYLMFYFLMPQDENSEKPLPRFVRWYNKKQKQ